MHGGRSSGLRKRGKDASWVTPLFTEEEGLAVLDQIETVDFDTPFSLGDVGTVTFIPAGHILGAAIIDLRLTTPEGDRRLVFSGDLGVHGARLLGHPHPVAGRVDSLIMESTYGDRSREEEGDRTERLFEIIDKDCPPTRQSRRPGLCRGPHAGSADANQRSGRSKTSYRSGRVRGQSDGGRRDQGVRPSSREPVATDAGAARRRRLASRLRRSAVDHERRGVNRPQPVAEPAVIISASGMCTAGRIKHHLKHTISDSRNTVLFVGYQAVRSLGRVIQSGTSPVRIFGDWYPVAARIETIEGFSAHADREELIGWFDALGAAPGQTFIVHGEEDASLSLAQGLADRCGGAVTVPNLGDQVELP